MGSLGLHIIAADEAQRLPETDTVRDFSCEELDLQYMEDASSILQYLCLVITLQSCLSITHLSACLPSRLPIYQGISCLFTCLSMSFHVCLYLSSFPYLYMSDCPVSPLQLLCGSLGWKNTLNSDLFNNDSPYSIWSKIITSSFIYEFQILKWYWTQKDCDKNVSVILYKLTGYPRPLAGAWLRLRKWRHTTVVVLWHWGWNISVHAPGPSSVSDSYGCVHSPVPT